MYVCQYAHMNAHNAIRRITANLPAELLEQATQVTHSGITETLIQGLKLIKRTSAYEKAQSLKGNLNLEINLKESRERSHR